MLNNLILIALRIYLLLQDEVKNFLKKTIATEMQEIISTNPRSQKKENTYAWRL